MDEVAEAERAKAPGRTGLAIAVARYLFKLMAYKDEYEVARLYADGAFQRQLEQAFEGDLKLEFHLAPPMFARRDPTTGQLVKMTLRALADEGFPGSGGAAGPARNVRSTCSAARPSGARSAR